ncbi:hypothetical protein SFHH103_03075 [Sinorhizobium fredii HH103]|uniref:Uncharacterized protein n=1 Tax=Sinorhizobium fredii (strain HH103) TaxID=1117943 RepID=G9A1I7_SINF1|nr:hypothetical protein SFHH103_03075 [Sinorhizobium fredii HH103]
MFGRNDRGDKIVHFSNSLRSSMRSRNEAMSLFACMDSACSALQWRGSSIEPAARNMASIKQAMSPRRSSTTSRSVEEMRFFGRPSAAA